MLESAEDRPRAIHLHRGIVEVLGQLIAMPQGALVLEPHLLQAGLDGGQGGPLALQLLAALCDLLLGLLERLGLGDDNPLGLVVQVNGQHPAAEASGSLGNLGYGPGIELGLRGEIVHLGEKT